MNTPSPDPNQYSPEENLLYSLRPTFDPVSEQLLRERAPETFDCESVIQQMRELRSKALSIITEQLKIFPSDTDEERAIEKILVKERLPDPALLKIYDWLRSAMEKLVVPLRAFDEAKGVVRKKKFARSFRVPDPDGLTDDERRYAESDVAIALLAEENDRIYRAAVSTVQSLAEQKFRELRASVARSFSADLIEIPDYLLPSAIPSVTQVQVKQMIEEFFEQSMPFLTQRFFDSFQREIGQAPSLQYFLDDLRFLKEQAFLFAVALHFVPETDANEISRLRKQQLNAPVSEEEKGDVDSWVREVLKGDNIFVRGQIPFDAPAKVNNVVDLSQILSMIIPPRKLTSSQLKYQGVWLLLKSMNAASKALIQACRKRPRPENN